MPKLPYAPQSMKETAIHKLPWSGTFLWPRLTDAAGLGPGVAVAGCPAVDTIKCHFANKNKTLPFHKETAGIG